MTKAQTKEVNHAAENAKAWLGSIEEMNVALESADDQSREAAEERIHESVLSVQVRDDWRTPGTSSEDLADAADEYCILLTTGGPALRIWGKLGYCEPIRAEMQYQDWGTPWTRYPCAETTLLAFARQFYFRG